MGLKFRIVVPHIDEHMERFLPPDKLVEAISAEKAAAVTQAVGGSSIVIAADTVVAWNGEILGKPVDESDARRMLGKLAGHSHEVFTGFTIRQGEQVLTQSERTKVTFRSLSQEEIAAYVRTKEPMDKAGAYGIQAVGSLLVEGIEGDYFNVMGLPVCRLGEALKEFGVFCL